MNQQNARRMDHFLHDNLQRRYSLPSIRRFAWCRNVFLAYSQEPPRLENDMLWTCPRQSISKEQYSLRSMHRRPDMSPRADIRARF
jgi:hypothetical protein